MRAVINISLPKQLVQVVDGAVASGNYSGRSDFFRALLRDWLESRTLKELKTSQEQMAGGQSKLLASLKDLR